MLISQIRDFMIVIYSYINWDFKPLLTDSAVFQNEESLSKTSHRCVRNKLTALSPRLECRLGMWMRNQIDKLLAQQNILIRFNKWIGEIYRISMLISVMLFVCFKGTLHVNRIETGWGGPHGEFKKQTFYSISTLKEAEPPNVVSCSLGMGESSAENEWLLLLEK